MTEEMWTHENSTLEFRQGYRQGMEKALEVVDGLIKELRDDLRHEAAVWVQVARTYIDDELSMYEVGDEE